jgi:hypothetical protein
MLDSTRLGEIQLERDVGVSLLDGRLDCDGKMRAANGLALGTGEELELPMGGLTVGPTRTAGYEDLSANSPGRDGFTPIIEKNIRPDERKTTMSFVSRIPGPGEPGFRCIQQMNLFPRENIK